MASSSRRRSAPRASGSAIVDAVYQPAVLDWNTKRFAEGPGDLGTLLRSSDVNRTEAMLENSKVATRLPAQDLQRARTFYADKLGLEPVDEQPEGLLYRCGDSEFALFKSAGEPSGEHTQMVWEVEDIEAVVGELRDRGVAFERYDAPGLTMAHDIADVRGGCRARAERACAWPGSKTARGTYFRSGSTPAKRP